MATRSSPVPTIPLGLLLRQVRDLTRNELERELAAAGHALTFSQYLTLKKLADGVASASDLARWTELNPGAMTRLLDQLEDKRLVARVAHPDDRRALRIQPTKAARALFPVLHRCALRVQERALAGMDAGERSHLIRLLEQVRDNLNEAKP